VGGYRAGDDGGKNVDKVLGLIFPNLEYVCHFEWSSVIK